jgi:hypothetical protein
VRQSIVPAIMSNAIAPVANRVLIQTLMRWLPLLIPKGYNSERASLTALLEAAAMGILALFQELTEWILMVPKLVKLNSKQRQEIRDVVGELADELDRGLQLVKFRVDGAIRIATSSSSPPGELDAYLAESEVKLSNSFSEFKICRGIREKRDHFAQLFHPAKASIRTENIGKVERLLGELERDERLIYDEVGPLLNDLRVAARADATCFPEAAENCLSKIAKRQKQIKKLARKIHDAI